MTLHVIKFEIALMVRHSSAHRLERESFQPNTPGGRSRKKMQKCLVLQGEMVSTGEKLALLVMNMPNFNWF